MNVRRSVVIVVCAALGAALLLARRTPMQAVSQPAQPALRLRWPEGTRSLYALSWTSRTAGLITPQAGPGKEARLSASTDLKGTVALEGLGESGGGPLVAVSFVELSRYSFALQGRETVQDPKEATKELLGVRALVSLSPRGELQSLAFADGTTPGARAALRALVQQLQLTLPAADETTWEAVEPATAGTLRVRYTRAGLSLAREPVQFVRLDAVPEGLPLDGAQTLKGGASATLDADARLLTLQDAQEWRYVAKGMNEPSLDAGFTFVLERRGEEPFEAQAVRAQLSGARAQAVRGPVDDPDRAHRRDTRLAGALGEDDVFAALDHADRGRRAGHDLVVKAAAYLRLHPEALPALVARFPELGTKGRRLTLDLLASAGDGKSLAALRTVLASKAAHQDPHEFGMLVQRLSLVEEPDADSAHFLADELRRARLASEVPAQQGAAAALGAMSDRLQKDGHAELADEAVETLRRELVSTSDPKVQRALVSGLGNARRAEDVPRLVELGQSEDPRLRLEVASALRGMDSDGARAALLRLAADKDATVAGTALEALQRQALASADFGALRELVASGKVPPGADAPLVQLIRERRAQAGSDGDAILRVLLQRNRSPDSDLLEAIRALLAQHPG